MHGQKPSRTLLSPRLISTHSWLIASRHRPRHFRTLRASLFGILANISLAVCAASLPLRRADELDLEAAAVGGLAVAAAGIVEVEDDFTRKTDCRFAHVLRLEAFR